MFAIGSRLVTPLGASTVIAILNEDRYKVTGPCGLIAIFTRKQILASQRSTTLFTPQSPSVMIIDQFVTNLTEYEDRVLFPKLKEYFESYLQTSITNWLNPENGQFVSKLDISANKDVYAVIFLEDSDTQLELMGDNDTNTIGVLRNRCVIWKQSYSVITCPEVRMQVFTFNLE